MTFLTTFYLQKFSLVIYLRPNRNSEIYKTKRRLFFKKNIPSFYKQIYFYHDIKYKIRYRKKYFKQLIWYTWFVVIFLNCISTTKRYKITNYITLYTLYICINIFTYKLEYNDLSTVFRTHNNNNNIIIKDTIQDPRSNREENKDRMLFNRSFHWLCEGIEKFIIAGQANEKFVLLSVDISGKMKGRFTVSRRGTVFECIWII